MIRQHTITTVEKERGETQEHIDICTKHCPYPARKCNGECDYYKAQVQRIKRTKRLKKNVIIY